MRIAGLLITICLLVASDCAYSQYGINSIPLHREYFSPRFHEISTNDPDITVSTITTITQSFDGYIWIGTRLGLARFNGNSFVNLTKKFNEPIMERDINAILEDKNHVIWIGTGRGLITYKNNKIRLTSVEKKFNNIEVFSLKLDKSGDIWVGARTGLFKIYGDSLIKIKEVASETIWSIYIDSKERIWVSIGISGVIKIENGKTENFIFNKGTKEARVYTIFEDSEHNIWFGGDNGVIAKFIGNKIIPVPLPKDFENRSVQSFAEDAEHNLWISTIGNGLIQYRDGAFRRFTTKHGLSADAIKSLFVDKENNLWIGTSGAGLNKLKDNYISTYTVRDGLPNNAIWSLYSDKRNRLWVGTSNGLTCIEDNKIKKIYNYNLFKNKPIRAICSDNNGTVWIGTNGSGLYTLQNEQIKPFTKKLSAPEATIKALFIDSDRRIWVGSNSRCFYLKNGERFNFEASKKTPANVRQIIQDKMGNIWFGCGFNGIYKWDNKNFHFFGKEAGLNSIDILSLYYDDNNVIWITTGKGLSRLKNNKIINFEMEGILKDLMFYKCVEDNLGQMWLSSNIGIVKVIKKELNDFADEKIKSFTTQFLGKDDGLLSTECNGGAQSSGLKMDDGRVWFPTMNGLAVIDPYKIRKTKNNPPNVLIESIKINDSLINFNEYISASSNDRFEFIFACLSFKNSPKNRYKYMIENLDHDWIDAGNRTVAYYNNIPHGDYKLRVIAANSDGVWNMTGASAIIHIRPMYYETWWFYSGMALLLLGSIYFVYIYRLKALEANRKRLSELVETRTSQLNRELKEKQQKEHELKESEERYEYFIEASNEAFYDWDLTSNIIIFSYRWAEILETEYSTIGNYIEQWEKAIHPDDFAHVSDSLQKHLKGDTAYFEIEYRVITLKGNVRWIFDRGKVVKRAEDGKPLRMAGTMHDITEKKSMENEFLKMKKIESIGILAGGIAHDFNNILTSILGNISLAKHKIAKNDFSKVDTLLTNSEKASFRAKDLTYQLLTFSKGGAPIIKTTSIIKIINDSVEFATHGTNIRSEINIQDDLWLVDIDEGQISQVIQNIIINACQAMPAGGSIYVNANNYEHNSILQKDIPLSTGEFVKVSIKDEGIGILKELIDKIFDPYFTTKENGQGLGLATTYSIIRKHNGTITVESELNKGTTFTFFLPKTRNQ